MPTGNVFVDFAGFIGSTVLAFFPPRYQSDKVARGPALASALFEGFLAVSFMIGRIYVFVPHAGLVPSKLANQLFDKNGGNFMAANAVAGAANFWLDPIVVVCLYFFFESVVRYFAAIEGSRTIGTLPLYTISIVHGLVDKVAHQQYLGGLIVDQIVPGDEQQDYAFQVRSCRPKLDWNRYVTVEFRGEFFECFREDQGPLPRRFIYYLRKSPVGRLVVVIRNYKPDEVLRAWRK
jgi:hypothetical protein